ncbi:methyltransferase domain-containing protein [Hazenella sp. IB182353]|uniref:class I SAM-dependent methyltransferase n=1 Tax=Polycladospora coralii TaxID=2771432 RepID=UPI00174659B8|nr:methyltransferase domain-containing protein [Polycladospora coralii]MBS7530825.1 methyltransferase domain-containing protein [Polycladospora coralii]
MHAKADVTEEVLSVLRDKSSNQQLLDTLIYLSRLYLGFFVKHTPRAYEYVWLIEKIGDPRGKKILDIGAGITPLPIYLAYQGAEVYTVDFSEMHDWFEADRSHWFEWGYVDYQHVHANIFSYQKNILDMHFPNQYFDVIYSISVIEHMAAHDRRHLWNKMNKWLKDDQHLLLTLDLIKDTEQLHNYYLDLLIEESAIHGSIHDLKTELERGFKIKEIDYMKEIPFLEQNIDIAMLVGNKKTLVN